MVAGGLASAPRSGHLTNDSYAPSFQSLLMRQLQPTGVTRSYLRRSLEKHGAFHRRLFEIRGLRIAPGLAA